LDAQLVPGEDHGGDLVGLAAVLAREACDQRFDVTGNLENFCELNKALFYGI
jgi:hypothetical protein